MARIHRQVGALTQLIEELEREGIGAFKTLDEIRSFQNNCENSLHRIKEECSETVRQEIVDLESRYERWSLKLDQKIREREALLRNELEELTRTLARHANRNMLMRLFFFSWKRRLTKRKRILENSFKSEVERPFRKGFAKIDSLRAEIEDRKNNFDNSARDREEQERILSFFGKHQYLFYGAEGEEMVARELSRLPDTYTVINDYRLEFSEPIYDSNNNDRIHSIQIDHVVVGPTGLYVVETKNWSRETVENTELFSPVTQLKRYNFAIFKLLNWAIGRGDFKNFSIYWEDKGISPKNILCLINHMPDQEFEYVKILSKKQIAQYIGYIGSRKPTFDQNEVESLAEYLLSRIT